MKKNVLVFGLIAGGILCINYIVMISMMYSNPGFKSNDFLGYAFMLVVLSLIFFGVRNYRNKELDGIISFGKAFKTGLYITLVASTLYVVVWLFYYYFFVPDFMEVYTEHVLQQCTSEAELTAKKEEMEKFSEWYENPLLVVLLTYAEVLPLGLVVTLISAIILKRKQNEAKRGTGKTKVAGQ